MKAYRAHFFSFVSSLLLFSCGGGGDSSNPSQPPPVQPPPVIENPITVDNAADIAGYGIAVIESVYQVAQLISPALAPELVSISDSISNNCVRQGEYITEHTDADNNGQISVGDTLNIEFINCVPDFTEQAIDGNAVIEILASDSLTLGYQIDLDLIASDSDGAVQFASTGMEVKQVVVDKLVEVSLRTVSAPFRVSLNNISDTISNLSINYIYDQDNLTYSIDHTFRVNSDIFGFDFSCESNSAMRGLVYRLPTEYVYRCGSIVSAGNYITLIKSADDADTVYQLRVNNSLRETVSYNDSEFYEGSIGFAIGAATESSFANSVESLSLRSSDPNNDTAQPVRIQNILYDEQKQLAYATSIDFSGTGSTSRLQKIDVEEMRVLDSLQISADDWATRFALSENGEYLYLLIAQNSVNNVHIISTNTMEIIGTVNLNEFADGNSLSTGSVSIETVAGDETSWIVSFNESIFDDTQFLVFDGVQLTSSGRISIGYSGNVVMSESPGSFVIFNINGFNAEELSLRRFTLNNENVWEQTNAVLLENAEIGNNGPMGQFSVPLIDANDSLIFTEYGYVFSKDTLQLVTKLSLNRPMLSVSSGLVFDGVEGSRENMYDLATLNQQASGFYYEVPFSQQPWNLYKGSDVVFFFGSGGQFLRVGIYLFD